MAELIVELEALFRELGEKHHQAFRDTDGDDPEWPLWYAHWLMDRLPALLDAELTKSELVYLNGASQQEAAAGGPRYALDTILRQVLRQAVWTWTGGLLTKDPL